MTYYLEDLTRLVRTKVIECECGCWYWTGACNAKGYPRFELRGEAWLVHRYAYDRLVRPIDDEMTLDHRNCTSHRCIRPDHMDVVTRGENSTRANASRWHSIKFDEHGNATEIKVCEACKGRDGRGRTDDGHPTNFKVRPTVRMAANSWADLPDEADDAVGLDL